MESVIKFFSALIDKDGKGVKVLFKLLLLLFFFSILALIPLWLAKKLDILPSSSITIDNGPSKAGVSNVVEQEKPLRLLDNVEIYSDILTLDNLSFSVEEQEILDGYKTKFKSPRVSAKVDVFKNGFSIVDKFSSKVYPYRNTSFSRFNSVFNDTLIEKHLSTSKRKQIFLSEEYWKMVDKGLDVYLFPESIQSSIAVLRIFCAKSDGILYTGVDRHNQDINNAIVKATGQKTISIPNEESYLFVCVSKGEKITFQSTNYSWTINISDILNMPASRGDNDVTIIDWSATNK